jgi:uncharacterized membrane protein
MKKDKRSLKIKKTRHVHRKNKSKGKFWCLLLIVFGLTLIISI